MSVGGDDAEEGGEVGVVPEFRSLGLEGGKEFVSCEVTEMRLL